MLLFIGTKCTVGSRVLYHFYDLPLLWYRYSVFKLFHVYLVYLCMFVAWLFCCHSHSGADAVGGAYRHEVRYTALSP